MPEIDTITVPTYFIHIEQTATLNPQSFRGFPSPKGNTTATHILDTDQIPQRIIGRIHT
jgi:hypothetical protein